ATPCGRSRRPSGRLPPWSERRGAASKTGPRSLPHRKPELVESVNVRNLDDIQEEERGARGTRLLSLLLASLAGAAIVTAGVVVSRKGGAAAKDARDPLAELVAQAKGTTPSSDKLETRDVSFPGILSDEDKPTTALAAVKDERGRLVAQDGTLDEPMPPPPATDRLPVVPLPSAIS